MLVLYSFLGDFPNLVLVTLYYFRYCLAFKVSFNQYRLLIVDFIKIVRLVFKYCFTLDNYGYYY